MPIDAAPPSPALATRRISFPPEAVFQSVIQDGDNNELWLILNTLDHGGGGGGGDGVLDIDRHNHAGITPLHQCVLNNNLDGVKMLMNFGADVNVSDVYGLTPLHTASACGFLQMASLLIVFGADVFARANDGDLPIDFAKDTDMAQLLQAEMVAQVHARRFLASCIAYYCRQWALWILSTAIVFFGHLLDFFMARFRAYVKRRWRQDAEHKDEHVNDHDKTE